MAVLHRFYCRYLLGGILSPVPKVIECVCGGIPVSIGVGLLLDMLLGEELSS